MRFRVELTDPVLGSDEGSTLATLHPSMSNRRRQELYDRIRSSSKDEVILEEMIRLGFWPHKGPRPADPASERARQRQLEQTLRTLVSESGRLGNVEAMKKEARQRRLAQARDRREQTRRRREEQRAARKAAWAERKAQRIDYLGDEVSTGLSPRASDAARLERHGLPVLHDAAQLAAAMELSVPQLRFLAYDRAVAEHHHYVRFTIPKKTGGERLICAPMPRLKQAQRWVLEQILAPLPTHPAAHGFVPDRSICSNARPHVGAGVVVNLDLRDFFPSVHWVRVRGLFGALGYSPQVATILALLCTARPVDEIELDGRVYYVATGPRALPQGSPASPAITNWLGRRLDARLAGLAAARGFRYTRYADDLTFSAVDRSAAVGSLLAACERIVTDEGFCVHPQKTRVMRAGRRQEVTGLVVNDKLGIDRTTLRRFRALLFQIERDGPKGKHWGHSIDVLASIVGFASYVAMVDPAKGAPLLERARAVATAHGYRPQRRVYPTRGPSRGPTPDPSDAAATSEPTSSKPPIAEETSEAPTEAEPPTDSPPGRKRWWQFWKS
ncbi:MAG: reverse transcriptase family protein [Myxococcota bacterium]